MRLEPQELYLVKQDKDRVVYRVGEGPGVLLVVDLAVADVSSLVRSVELEALDSLPLPERLHSRREEMGLSQTDLALVCGMKQAHISMLENRKTPVTSISLETKERLKAGLKVDDRFFLEVPDVTVPQAALSETGR